MSDEQRAWRYVTKYWLAAGILHKRGVIRNGYFYYGQVSPSDHFETQAEALVRAEELRKRKLTSLHRQIKRIEAIDFEEGT